MRINCKYILGIIVVVSLLLSGCSVFEPRSADEPDNSSEWNSYPITPGQTMDNFLSLFNDKSLSIKYRSMFGSSFKFRFEPRDITEYGLPDSWDLNTEVESFNNLCSYLSDNNGFTLELTPVEGEEDEEFQVYMTEYYISRNYAFEVEGSANGLPSVFRGKCVIKMEVNVDRIWKITEWYDYRENFEWTWGRLKYEYSL